MARPFVSTSNEGVVLLVMDSRINVSLEKPEKVSQSFGQSYTGRRIVFVEAPIFYETR